MFFHLQPTRLTIRIYKNEGGYERREPFIGTAQVDLKSNGEAFIHAMHNREPLKPNTFRKVAMALAKEYGVTSIKWEHSGKDQEFETKPADL